VQVCDVALFNSDQIIKLFLSKQYNFENLNQLCKKLQVLIVSLNSKPIKEL